MKKSLLLLFLVLSVVFTSFSQNFNGGLTFGLVTSQVDGDSWSGYSKTGFLAGGFVSRKLSEKMGAQMELRYITKGALKDDTKKDGLTYYKSKLNYVEIPLLGQYYTGRVIFEAGPAFGVLVNSSEEDLYGEISDQETIAFNQMEISGIGGFSYIVTEKILISFRMQYSMIPIRKNFSDNISTVYYYQKYSFNNLISFSGYYRL